DQWFTNVVKNEGGYVTSVTIGGTKTTSGRVLRENVFTASAMGQGLRSAAMDFIPGETALTIVCYGYGHGVGMSQYGANEYAKNEGMTYREILAHYYPGTEVR